ncbi:MAG: hypothetical protein FWE88_05610 [Phycisphaerae bacterium]|nr:hypothetical protein [Phycisphaerae bacterium]
MDVATGMVQSVAATQKGSVVLEAGDKPDVTLTFDARIDITIKKGAYEAPKAK